MLKLAAWIELILHLSSPLAFRVFENSFPPPSSLFLKFFFFLNILQD